MCVYVAAQLHALTLQSVTLLAAQLHTLTLQSVTLLAAQLHTLTLQSVTLLSKSGNEQSGGTASSIFFSNKLSERERVSFNTRLRLFMTQQNLYSEKGQTISWRS